MRISSTFNPWIAPSQLNPGAHLRLFCFPYAGGGASIFRSWSENLPGEINVCPVQLPGRENRFTESAFTDLSSLICGLEQALLPYMDIPFAFFGHSMGALISFELTRHLRKHQGLAPVHLFISAHRAPHIPSRGQPIHDWPEPAFVEKLGYLNGTPKEVLQNAELMRLMLPTLRADFALCETYIYSADDPLTCSISAFGGLRDDQVHYDDLVAWSILTQKPLHIHMLSGDHFFLNSEKVPLLNLMSQGLERLLR